MFVYPKTGHNRDLLFLKLFKERVEYIDNERRMSGHVVTYKESQKKKGLKKTLGNHSKRLFLVRPHVPEDVTDYGSL